MKFGESSSLRLIGKESLCKSGVTRIHSPDNVEELCEGCFACCKSFSRGTFGVSSSLKLIRKGTFRESVRDSYSKHW